MKHLTIILLLFTINLQAQLDPVGNIVFTDLQKQAFIDAFNDPSGTFPGNTAGYFDDITDINTRAEEFRSDMSSSGVDRGAWDGFQSGNNSIASTGDSTDQPFPPNWSTYGYGPQFSNRNIHAAALKAYAFDDATLAGYVFTALLQRANDIDLDFSNGGSRREVGEPTKTNATYGTNERFPFERQNNYDASIKGNPWFMVSSKMEQYLISYSIIYDLVKNTASYTSNADTLNYWFNDFYRFIRFSADINTNYWLGSNWRSFQQDWARPTLHGSAGSAYDSSGNKIYQTADGILQTFNNRAADGYSYIGMFGKVYNDSDASDFAFDIFRGILAVATFPDGTFMEHYRWDANPDYVFTNLNKFFLMAHTNEVAVAKGFLPISYKGKYYDHVETLGSDDLYSGATFSSTNVSEGKTLKLLLENLSRYYRTTSNGGFQGARNRATVSSGSVTSTNTAYTTGHVQNLMQGIYLSYDTNNTEIRDFKNYNSSAGYVVGLNANMQANGQGPHSLGTSWGLGQAIGGHVAFGEFDAFASAPTGNIKYVTTTGGGDGSAENNAWSLSTALTSAQPNDIVYIKKGVYNVSSGITSNIDGTTSQHIVFKGYNNNIGDLDNVIVHETAYSSLIDGSIFPVMKGASSTGGFGWTVNGSYIELHNFVINNYLVGNTWNVDNGVIKNTAYTSFGIQDGSGFTSGEALRLVGNYNVLEDVLGLNFGSIGFNITGANNALKRIYAIGNNESRPNGYYILVSGTSATDNLIEDSVIERHTSDSNGNHQGHGYIAKNGATYNTFKNSTAYNTGIEASYKNSHHNTWENIEITTDDSRFPNTYSASIRVVNGSHDNLFKSISVTNNLHTIEFRDYDDGTSSDDNIDANEGGSDNTFINIVGNRTQYGIWFSDGQGAANSSFSNDNTIINSTFNNTGSLNFLQISQNVSNLTFVNAIINGITGGLQATNGGTITGIIYENSNFSNNAFSAPNGTNITTLTPVFVDASNSDFRLNLGNLEIGQNPSLVDNRASTDFLSTTRTSPYSLGAYEYDGIVVEPEVPTILQNNFYKNALFKF